MSRVLQTHHLSAPGCGCLGCAIIAAIRHHQAGRHGDHAFSVEEVVDGLALASGHYAAEIVAELGAGGNPLPVLATLAMSRLVERRPEVVAAESAPFAPRGQFTVIKGGKSSP